MAAASTALPQHVDTVIIGGGPSSLILSYILHGHIPYYNGHHHDAILHAKLSRNPNLLCITPDLYAHFYSSLRYSTQALPVNTLLDTLVRPNADTVIDSQTCVEWRYEPEKAVSHVVLTSSPTAGGQWADNPVHTSEEIKTLSYSEMLSLPGYSYSTFYSAQHGGKPAPEFERPTRAQAAAYFAAYPSAAGISSTLHTSVTVTRVSRASSGSGFTLTLQPPHHTLHATHLVLATGIFTHPLPPPAPLSLLPSPTSPSAVPTLPLLLIGSGFTAADTLLSAPARSTLHLFRWAPATAPSPLRACHSSAYPEYARVYRAMRRAAGGSGDGGGGYEGVANGGVEGVARRAGGGWGVAVRRGDGRLVHRAVGALAYAVGRRGDFAYLERGLRAEVLGVGAAEREFVDGRALRDRIAEGGVRVAPGVLAVGSLTGDSLVRHAYGGCVCAAAEIMGAGERKMGCAKGRNDAIEADGWIHDEPKALESGLAHLDFAFG